MIDVTEESYKLFQEAARIRVICVGKDHILTRLAQKKIAEVASSLPSMGGKKKK